MPKPSRRQRRNMERALQGWEANAWSLAGSYLGSRGLRKETVAQFRLGVVASPEPGFEKYVGRLVLPYFDRKGVCGFEFRCLTDHKCKDVGCERYNRPKGSELSFWNLLPLVDSHADTAHVCEGVMDGLTLTQIVDNPVVALPGATNWRPCYRFHLNGFERVVLWADPDEGGEKMRAKFRQFVPQVDIVNMPAPDDVNSLYVSKGAEAVRVLFEDDVEEEL